ncbi:hypothetical protein EMIHUDRAFT_195898 [Emiliania huxleyi CCMP1516]|uniref:Trichome birefringence-like C-terminal domain-containing protein n=2 Tax=Emiliania huxleyi TaxID=2903 RepID=A0A0D3J343_EMIH1|nr:hypothetical protein EMIHUDRAFT_195898 [Emiliania huxleyi CCMP1516]EOD17928.1 hypothetical protein EMIHUDRAFT_195898 [Emiliania huxleyi CCMP1516]|eukprot:XP_005770357.1 hypothetical protein EMIHUDRAFT_195898 [Emiliania huxleyi CCMP1516]
MSVPARKPRRECFTASGSVVRAPTDWLARYRCPRGDAPAPAAAPSVLEVAPSVRTAPLACFQSGEWIEGPHFHERPYRPMDAWQSSCDRHGSRRQYGNWLWRSHAPNCEHAVSDIYSLSLCGDIAARNKVTNITIVGDSLNFQMFASLVLTYGDNSRDIQKGPCEYCSSFWDIISRSDVALFNRGSHYVDPATLLIETTTFASRLSSYPHVAAFWRTTLPGHPGCDRFTTPTPSTERFVNSPLPYHWDEFASQNSLAVAVLRKVARPRVSIVDIYNFTIGRRDRHQGKGDCLHYCLPGPPDDWVRLFIYALKLRQRITSPLSLPHNTSAVFRA